MWPVWPLVLLHGSGGHAEAYVRNLAAHSEHFSTWSIDMLGHGYTDMDAGRIDCYMDANANEDAD